MKIVRNTGTERVIDLIRPWLKPDGQLDVVSPSLSLFAFAEVSQGASALPATRLLLPREGDLAFLGGEADRPARNHMQARWLARRCADWIEGKAEVRRAPGSVPQSAIVLRDPIGHTRQAILGSFGFTTEGLGVTPGNPLSLIQASETDDESVLLSQWFDAQWAGLQTDPGHKVALIEHLNRLAAQQDPFRVYALILLHLFRDRGEGLDEERIVKSATGIRNTVVWKKLFRFQRDGVIGALDKQNSAVKVYAKLPGWFTVATPLGTYNPDWAVLVEEDGRERLYLVVETKGLSFCGCPTKHRGGKNHLRRGALQGAHSGQ